MSTIKPIEELDLLGDGSILKIMEVAGSGNLVDEADTVYYKHETRFDNGQLVDLNETRKVADKFLMNDNRYHDFLRHAFYKIKKGEICWIKVGESQHHGMYHKNNLQM